MKSTFNFLNFLVLKYVFWAFFLIIFFFHTTISYWLSFINLIGLFHQFVVVLIALLAFNHFSAIIEDYIPVKDIKPIFYTILSTYIFINVLDNLLLLVRLG